MLTRRIEGAQKKVEEFHFVNRKNVVKYDDVLNEQRSQVYRRRREILDGEDLRESVMGWIEDVIEATVDVHTEGEFAEEWDWDALWTGLHTVYPTRVPLESIDREHASREQLLDLIFDDAVAYYEEREREWTEMEPSLPRDIERWFTLQVLDVRWREHLDNMDYMRQGIGLRGYAQKDPLVEYKAEGTAMFDEMNGVVKQEIVRMLMHAQIEAAPDTPETAPSEQLSYRHDDATLDASALEALASGEAVGDAPDEGLPVVEQRHIDPEKNIGRNDPCWCGSGKKFKRCHGA
jgi:preprotein translocase subunit SecA